MQNQYINQHNLSESFNTASKDLSNLHGWFLTNIKGKSKKIFSYLCGVSNMYSIVRVGQTRIANKAKCSREQANRILGKFHKMGLIIKKRRYNTTCLYTLNPIFQRPDVREALERIIKPFLFLSLSLLTSLGVNTTQSGIKPYIYHPDNLHREMSQQERIRLLSIRSESGNFPPKSDRSLENLDRKSSYPRRGIPVNGRKRIKTLKLTKAGEIKLGIFPQEARDEADKQLRRQTKPVKDLFRLYWAFCKAYCDQKGVAIDWRTMFSGLSKEGMDNEAPGINPKDPYEYEYIIDRSIDPTIPKADKTPRIDPNNVGHSIYHNAVLPARRTPNSRESIEKARDKMQQVGESAGGDILGITESIISLMMKTKTID